MIGMFADNKKIYSRTQAGVGFFELKNPVLIYRFYFQLSILIIKI